MPTEISIGKKPKTTRLAVAVSLEDEAQSLLERTKTIVVRTQADCTAAADLARSIRAKRLQWSAHEGPVVEKTKGAYYEARDRFNKLDKPMKAAEDALKKQIGTFKLAARQIAESATRATNRVQLDQQTQALARHAQSVEEASAQALATRQEEIAAAEDAGDQEKAARLRTMPLDVVFDDAASDMQVMFGPGELAAALEPEDGISVGQGWDFEVIDPSLVPDDYYSIDEKLIKARVAVLKGATVIPGVRVFPKPRVALK